MDDGHIFLSYSRRQFYFAESVVLSFQAAGVKMWFDAQELAPGELWRDEIQRGLDEARGMVVIASHAAMESKYVREEWEPMLAAGKPVYIAIFEACDIPQELADGATAIVDMRGRFNRNFKRLLAAVEGKDKPKDRIPKENWLKLPIRLPFAVSFIAGVFVLATTFLVLGAVASFGDNQQLPFVFFSLLMSWYTGNLALDLIRRKFTNSQIWTAFILLTLLLLFIPQLLFLPLLMLLFYSFSRGMYRWLPTGEAPQWLRRRYGIGTLPTLRDMRKTLAEQKAPLSQRYTLYYAVADEPLAKQIEDILNDDGHVRVSHEEPADQHIVILTNQTPVSMLEEMVKRHPDTLTPILASNINPRAHVKAVGDFQFVDYRRHARSQIESISLFFQYPEEGKVIYGMNVLPQSTSVLLHPPGIDQINTLIRLTILFNLFFALSLIGVWIQETIAPTDVESTPSMLIFFVLAQVVLVVMLARYIYRINHRKISLRHARRQLFIQAGLSIFALNFAIPHLTIFFFRWSPLRHWLPNVETEAAKDTFPHARPYAFWQSLGRDIAITTVIVVLIVFDMTMTALSS